MQNETNPYQSQSSGSARTEGTQKLADKAQQAAEQAKGAAIERVQAARDKAQAGLDQGRTQVADRIRHVSSALRSAGDNLRDEDEFIARYVDVASERIEGIAAYVSSAEPGMVLRDVENFARRRPAVFFGGAFLVGLAAARFLKATVGSGRDEFQLDDSDLEDISPRYRGGYGMHGYAQEPITPSATIPVTETRSASVPRPTAPYGTPGYEGAGTGVGSPGVGSSTGSSGVGSSGLGSSSFGSTGSPGGSQTSTGGLAGSSGSSTSDSSLKPAGQADRPNGIFDATSSGSRTGSNT